MPNKKSMNGDKTVLDLSARGSVRTPQHLIEPASPCASASVASRTFNDFLDLADRSGMRFATSSSFHEWCITTSRKDWMNFAGRGWLGFVGYDCSKQFVEGCD
jgi:hypothetical protein